MPNSRAASGMTRRHQRARRRPGRKDAKALAGTLGASSLVAVSTDEATQLADALGGAGRHGRPQRALRVHRPARRSRPARWSRSQAPAPSSAASTTSRPSSTTSGATDDLTTTFTTGARRLGVDRRPARRRRRERIDPFGQQRPDDRHRHQQQGPRRPRPGAGQVPGAQRPGGELVGAGGHAGRRLQRRADVHARRSTTRCSSGSSTATSAGRSCSAACGAPRPSRRRRRRRSCRRTRSSSGACKTAAGATLAVPRRRPADGQALQGGARRRRRRSTSARTRSRSSPMNKSIELKSGPGLDPDHGPRRHPAQGHEHQDRRHQTRRRSTALTIEAKAKTSLKAEGAATLELKGGATAKLQASRHHRGQGLAGQDQLRTERTRGHVSDAADFIGQGHPVPAARRPVGLDRARPRAPTTSTPASAWCSSPRPASGSCARSSAAASGTCCSSRSTPTRSG